MTAQSVTQPEAYVRPAGAKAPISIAADDFKVLMIPKNPTFALAFLGNLLGPLGEASVLFFEESFPPLDLDFDFIALSSVCNLCLFSLANSMRLLFQGIFNKWHHTSEKPRSTFTSHISCEVARTRYDRSLYLTRICVPFAGGRSNFSRLPSSLHPMFCAGIRVTDSMAFGVSRNSKLSTNWRTCWLISSNVLL